MKLHSANMPVCIFRAVVCGASFHFSSLIILNSTQIDASTLETKVKFKALPEYKFLPVEVSIVAFPEIIGFSVFKMKL